MASSSFLDSDLGVVKIRALASARRFIARWKADGLHITLPAGVTGEEFLRVFNEWKPRLLSVKPKEELQYHIGFRYATEDWSVEIVADPLTPPHNVMTKLLSDGKADRFAILVAPGADLGTVGAKKLISRIIKDLAAASASRRLLPLAREEARRLGLEHRVKAFKVGRGIKRMGCCSASGEISLSCTLMMLPRALRIATITHELAHLTHFDHSPEFYGLWDSYLGHSHIIDTEQRAKIKLPLFQ